MLTGIKQFNRIQYILMLKRLINFELGELCRLPVSDYEVHIPILKNLAFMIQMDQFYMKETREYSFKSFNLHKPAKNI